MTPEERAEHQRELEAVVDEFWDIFKIHRNWNLNLGPIHISRTVGPQALFRIFLLIHGVAAVVGAVLILRGGRGSDLGIALVVGSLFAFGAFTAQVWSYSSERERVLWTQLFAPDRERRLRELVDRAKVLESKLNREQGAGPT